MSRVRDSEPMGESETRRISTSLQGFLWMLQDNLVLSHLLDVIVTKAPAHTWCCSHFQSCTFRFDRNLFSLIREEIVQSTAIALRLT